MEVIRELLKDTPIPKLIRIRQKFDDTKLENLPEKLRQELKRPGTIDRIKPGMKIAVAVGSRGVADIVTIVQVTIQAIKDQGGKPFVVPAMGSHGGATADGQREVLANLGITEETIGCPIHSSMEVVEVGKLDNGLSVWADKIAEEADGIVVINRVKPHTAFRGTIESGVAKMITIGLGKQRGADSCHSLSFKYMHEFIVKMADIKIKRGNILFGVASVENAYDIVSMVEAIPAENILKRDAELLEIAKKNMPRIMFEHIDVLLVDYLGKNISGDGMDPNITGRYPTPYATGGPTVNKLVVFNLTPQTHGNANGIGAADFTTSKVEKEMDRVSTYMNGLTSTVVSPLRLPAVLPTDKLCIQAAVKTCNAFDVSKAKIVRMRDTLHLGEIMISEALLEEAKAQADIEILGSAEPMEFDAAENLI